jgi:hypothetical protein
LPPPPPQIATPIIRRFLRTRSQDQLRSVAVRAATAEMEQDGHQYMESLKWMGDERLQSFCKRWNVITTGTIVPLEDRILCDILLGRIRSSKKFQAHIHDRKALGNESSDQTLNHGKSHSKGAGRDASSGARGGEGTDTGKSKRQL